MLSLSVVTLFVLFFNYSVCFGNKEEEKIKFDVTILNDEGLYGPPDGLRALDYEFCIPEGLNFEETVKTIEPDLECRRSQGRAGCSVDQKLCLGTTNQNWREDFRRFEELSFITKIQQNYWE